MEGSQLLIRVALLDNRQVEIDGVSYRLLEERDIRLVGVARYGGLLDDLLRRQPADVLLADVGTPWSPGDPTPFPILSRLPGLLRVWPSLRVVVVSAQGSAAEADEARRGGAGAYLLKGDQEPWANLGRVVRHVAAGDFYCSPSVAAMRLLAGAAPGDLTPRQLEILSLLTTHPDMTTFEVALRLGVAHSTVRNQLSQAYGRLGVSTRAAAIARLRPPH